MCMYLVRGGVNLYIYDNLLQYKIENGEMIKRNEEELEEERHHNINIMPFSNSNLLINSNFNISKYKTLSLIGNGLYQYLCEKWLYFWDAEGTCDYKDNSITMSFGRILQKVEVPAGRYTVTMNILQSDVIIAIHVNGYGYADYFITEMKGTGIKSFTFEVHEFNEIFFQLVTKSKIGVKIGWIKLEEGDVSTKYTLPNNEVELLKCKGYTQVSNPNLLMNSNFKVNQQGKTEYRGNNVYTVDRWVLWNGILTLQETGINIIRDNSSSDYYELRQYIEIDSNYILGKILVGSVCVDGIIYSGVYVIPFLLNEDFVKDIELFTNFYLRLEIRKEFKNILIFQIYNHGNQLHTINFAKLELGNAATLYIPPDPTQELLKCRYYYHEIEIISNVHLVTKDKMIAFIPCSPMRTMPRLSFKNNYFNTYDKGVCITDATTGNRIEGFVFKLFHSLNVGSISVNIEKVNHGLNKENCFLHVGKENKIRLDANIYLYTN